jgi:putative transposase
MINRTYALPVVRQYQLLGLSRSTAYSQPTPVSPTELALIRRIEKRHLALPFAGERKPGDLLRAYEVYVDSLPSRLTAA